MATYSLAGSGAQALTAGTGALRVHVTTIPSLAGNGRANPVNLYDVGLLRQGDGTDWWRAESIDAENMLLPLLQGTTTIGYALLNDATIDVTEVIGTSPFYPPPTSGASSLVDHFATELAADVAVTTTFSDVLTHVCAAGDWDFTAELEFSISSATQVALEVTDGVNVLATASFTLRTGTDTGHLFVTTGVLTLAASTTIHLRARDSSNNATARAAVTTFGGGNHATRLTGRRYL